MLVGGEEGIRRGGTRKIFFILAIVAITGWLYIILQSELFEIQEVRIEGAAMNDSVDIQKEVYKVVDQRASWRPWQTRQSWFLDLEALKQQVKDCFYLADVDIQKEGSHVLRLKIKEYPHKLVLVSGTSLYWIDLRGRLDSALDASDRTDAFQRLYGKRNSKPTDSPLIQIDPLTITTSTTDLIDPDRVRSLIGFTVSLQHLELPYRALQLDTVSSTKLTLINQDGKPIYFDLGERQDVDRQLQTYKVFMDAQKKKKDLVGYQYVDVRVPGMIYLK